MINVIAGSVLGGLDNIYGAIMGGIFLTFTQKVLPNLLVQSFGSWVLDYFSIIPIIVIFIVLMVQPEGISGISQNKTVYTKKLLLVLRYLLPIKRVDSNSHAR